ncbi:hypothetical protein Glove_71g18 [Diversispora epigaea]|uniref:Uncharacterized protein n=1 Tax=Diversispora epigaea TaxID=1348612 RepID=A0A397JEE7_9GLOM|nr:hypothetical protein Glove_71g18 [Diversispora epigaea]
MMQSSKLKIRKKSLTAHSNCMDYMSRVSNDFKDKNSFRTTQEVILELPLTVILSNGHTFPSVSKYRSCDFRQELENIQPNKNNIKIINKPSVSARIFNIILQQIHLRGIVNFENTGTRLIYYLMLITDGFELPIN